MSVLSPLFDFLIVVNPQKLSREFVKIHNINGFEAFMMNYGKKLQLLQLSFILPRVWMKLGEIGRKINHQKHYCRVELYISLEIRILISLLIKKTLLLGVGDAGTGVAEEVHLLGLNNMTVVRLGIGGVRMLGNSYRLDLAGRLELL